MSELKILEAKFFPSTVELLNAARTQNVASAFSMAVWEVNQPDYIFCHALGQTYYPDFKIQTTGRPQTWGSAVTDGFAIPSDNVGNASSFLRSQNIGIHSPFDLASLSKVLVLAPLAALLVERGLLTYSTRVKEVFGSFPNSQMTLGYLLSHTSGYSDWAPFWTKLIEFFPGQDIQKVPVLNRMELVKKWIFELPLSSSPGTKVVYSDVGAILAGMMLTEVTGHSVEYLARRWLWDESIWSYIKTILGSNFGIPTGKGLHFVNDLSLSKPRSDHGTQIYPVTEYCPWRKRILQGEVHDDNTWAMGGVSSHAGVFGTAYDVVRLAHKIVYGGFLSHTTLKQMFSLATPSGEPPRAYGWDMVSDKGSSAGTKFSSQTFGHLGFTGTSLWMDLKAKLIVCLLTNRVHPTRENNKIRELRPKFHDAVRTDLGY